VFELPPAEKLRLELAMPILEAEDRLKAGLVPDEAIFDTVLLVTGSRDAAEAATIARMNARLDRGQRVGSE
jgi:hypothetical protein